MKTPEISTTSSESVNGVGPSGTSDPGWEAIDRQLAEWSKDPAQFADGEYEAPTADMFSLARQVVRRMWDEGKPAPQWVVPDGEGGFVFERRDGPRLERLALCADGSMELTAFENSRFQFRRRIQ